KSNIHISQPDLNNDYSFLQLQGHNHPGWNTGIGNKEPTIPQYNYRIGYFFSPKQEWAFEVNFDHAKYIATKGQNAHLKGKINDLFVDAHFVTDDSVLTWFLNNGANF